MSLFRFVIFLTIRVVDTVVGRAIVMVIFCSVAAYKRLLAQWFFLLLIPFSS